MGASTFKFLAWTIHHYTDADCSKIRHTGCMRPEDVTYLAVQSLEILTTWIGPQVVHILAI